MKRYIRLMQLQYYNQLWVQFKSLIDSPEKQKFAGFSSRVRQIILLFNNEVFYETQNAYSERPLALILTGHGSAGFEKRSAEK